MPGNNELKEIKKEIIEARGLIIKSNNLTNSLSTEVRSIGKRQSSQERLFSVNSYVAYILFTVLIFTAVQLVYNQRKSALESDLKAARDRAAEAEKQLEALKRQRGAGAKPLDKELTALAQMIEDRNRQAAIDAYAALDPARLNPLEGRLLKDAVDRFRSDLSMEHYAKGLDLAEKSKYADAVEEFRASLRYQDDAGHATAAKIQMANALRLQGKPQEAIAVLQRVIEENLDRSLLDDAYWYLALSHQEAHQKDEAQSVLRALMRQFPDSQYYRAARVKQFEISQSLYSTDK